MPARDRLNFSSSRLWLGPTSPSAVAVLSRSAGLLLSDQRRTRRSGVAGSTFQGAITGVPEAPWGQCSRSSKPAGQSACSHSPEARGIRTLVGTSLGTFLRTSPATITAGSQATGADVELQAPEVPRGPGRAPRWRLRLSVDGRRGRLAPRTHAVTERMRLSPPRRQLGDGQHSSSATLGPCAHQGRPYRPDGPTGWHSPTMSSLPTWSVCRNWMPCGAVHRQASGSGRSSTSAPEHMPGMSPNCPGRLRQRS